MMHMLLACLLTALGVICVRADAVVSPVCEEQKFVLLRMACALCSGLYSRVRAMLRAPKPGVYMLA